jgi:hypothetical protein
MFGQKELGWQRLLIPSYFCQDVASSLLSTGVRIEVYPDGPDLPAPVFDSIGFQRGDAILIMNYFGLRSEPSYDLLPRDTIAIIENHTHDPLSGWARKSRADWCVVSLRKVLPVPDGAVLWSPTGRRLPPEPVLTDERRQAALEKLAAMSLKALYLEGLYDNKEIFRQLAISGNRQIARGEVSGMSGWSRTLLRTFPLLSWRRLRKENHQKLSAALSGIPWLKILQPPDGVDAVPFSGVLLFDTLGRRDYVREQLINEQVYPAILWSLESPVVPDILSDNIEFSRRMLSIHCDMRYSYQDMEKVAGIIRRAGEEFGNG